MAATPNLTLIDFRKKNLYGKINLDNQLVAPILGRTVSFGGEVLTFDFVADALQDLADTIESRAVQGRLTPSGPYAELALRTRTNDWKGEYTSYITQVRDKFSDAALGTTDDYNNTTDFRKFVSLFLNFAAQNAVEWPLTFGKFNISTHASLFTTGLVFDLGTQEYGNDYANCQKYFEDPNFLIFFQEAQNHGFILDRHAPWRFAVNFSAQKTQDYMKARGYLSTKDVFNKLYFSPLQAEFYEAVKVITYMYADLFPLDENGTPPTYAHICHENGKTSYSLKPRATFDPTQFANMDEMIEVLGLDEWLRAFCFIKGREANRETAQQEFDDIVREAISLKNYLDIEAALRYINEKFNPLKVSYFQGSPSFQF